LLLGHPPICLRDKKATQSCGKCSAIPFGEIIVIANRFRSSVANGHKGYSLGSAQFEQLDRR
jgi:hypothetical protein